jgi:hypothetical protein
MLAPGAPAGDPAARVIGISETNLALHSGPVLAVLSVFGIG